MIPSPGRFPALWRVWPDAAPFADPSLAPRSFGPFAAPAAFEWSTLDGTALGVAFACLALAGVHAALRRALGDVSSQRVLAAMPTTSRPRLEALFKKSEVLATSASILEVLFRLLFVACVLRVTALGEPLRWVRVVLTIAACGPVLWLTTEGFGRAVALRYGDRILARCLAPFAAAQTPVEGIGRFLALLRRSILRLLGTESDPESTREIVAGLREVLADAEISGKLDEAEKRVIGNVMALREVDVAAIMTPRTQLCALDVSEGVEGAVRLAAESSHSTLPVFEGGLDKVIGTVSARDLVLALSKPASERPPLAALLHPAFFVPETKSARELLSELRRHKASMAIVLDEYGGTAGLVSVGDILSELVGDIPDEYDEDRPAPVRNLGNGLAEVDAALHVSEVNEALHLEIPEESDFETLGGFVLAELGHFPVQGERFVRDGAEFSVQEASDRRVLKVRVRKLAGSAR